MSVSEALDSAGRGTACWLETPLAPVPFTVLSSRTTELPYVPGILFLVSLINMWRPLTPFQRTHHTYLGGNKSEPQSTVACGSGGRAA